MEPLSLSVVYGTGGGDGGAQASPGERGPGGQGGAGAVCNMYDASNGRPLDDMRAPNGPDGPAGPVATGKGSKGETGAAGPALQFNGKSFAAGNAPAFSFTALAQALSLSQLLITQNATDLDFLNAKNEADLNAVALGYEWLIDINRPFTDSKTEIDAARVSPLEQKVREQLHRPVTEVHMVAGIHPTMPYEYYLDVVRAAKRARPDIHVKAFTMVEIEHMLNISGKSEDEVFADLRQAGLGSCPGGGAEVLTDRVHKAVFREKTGPDRWLATARKVQQHGFKMNATMLYGHIERVEERVQHLIKLRELQDECGGFMAYIPLAFWPYHTDLANFGHVTTGNLDQRSIAVGRLMLDNFPHIKAYWIMLTQESAQTALSFGANDIDGTVTEEKITHDAGTTEPQRLDEAQIAHLIREAGYEPVQRTTVYEEIAAPA